jgi:hypothetical protein
MPVDWNHIHASALTYRGFLDGYATPDQRKRWDALHARVTLTDGQKTLLASFVRPMPVVCLAGAWCGDCVNQCPIFDHIAAASSVIDLRFIDRDADENVRSALSINGGNRVPVLVWLNEEGQEVSRFGDRTLSRYRELAATHLGPSCPTGLVPPDDSATAEVTREWIDEFERVHWILRLSPKYREQYGD